MPGGYHRPENFPKRCVAYTGTHDNETIVGWFKNSPVKDRRRALAMLKATPKDVHWRMIQAAMKSVADTVISGADYFFGLRRHIDASGEARTAAKTEAG